MLLYKRNAEDNSPVIKILNDIREMWRLMVALKSVQIIRPKEPLEIRDLQARRPEGDEVLLRVES